MRKRNVVACMTATALALTTLCGGVVQAKGTDAGYVKGDVNGDGYVGMEDVFYSALESFKLLVPEDAILPTVVQYNAEAADVDGDGANTIGDVTEMMKAVAGVSQWAEGSHKITSSDKTDVVYTYDGEYVIASVNIEELTETTIVYDKEKVEYEGRDNRYEKGFDVLGTVCDDEENGIVDVVAVCINGFADADMTTYGTIDLRFKVKDHAQEVTFDSCTGCGFILDNMAEGESFADAAKRYEDALYAETTVKTDAASVVAKKLPTTLEEAQQLLKMALKINAAEDYSAFLSDINKDGQVTLQDAQLALQLALKIVSAEELTK